MSALFLVWYFAYVMLGAFAHDFMATKVWGNINIGLLIGLGQFLSTLIITAIYVVWANRELDPRAEPSAPSWKTVQHDHAPGRRQRDDRKSRRQHRYLPPLRRGDLVHRDQSQQEERDRSRVLHGWSFVHRPQNGIAISGDYLSAASFLGIAGAIAVYGYDGFLYSIGFLVAWLVALLLVAELLRNSGKFTMADVLSFRLRQRPVRLAAATTTLAVCLFYLLAQMAGAGGLVALLLNITSDIGQALVIAVVGLLMIVYVLIGGMKGTTWVQIIKAALLIGGAALMTVMVLAKFGVNFSEMLGAAQSAVSASTTEAVAGRDVLAPGAQYGASLTSQINFVSLALALVLGTAGLPHVLMRFYTVPTAKEARRSVVWAIVLIGAFYLFTLALGYGAAALVGPDNILAAPGAQNSAAPLLAFELGGVILPGVISAVAFATILAVVAGLTITAATSFAHDIYASVLKSRAGDRGRAGAGVPHHGGRARHPRDRVGHPRRRTEHRVPGGAGVRGRRRGESADDPLFAVLATVQHPRCAVEHVRRPDLDDRLDRLLPGGVGSKTAMLPGVDFAWFPLANPGIVSIPLAFILGIVGTLTSPDRGDPEVTAEFEVRALTGFGAEKATPRTDRATECDFGGWRCAIPILETSPRTGFAFPLLTYVLAAIMPGATLPTPMYALYADRCTSRC